MIPAPLSHSHALGPGVAGPELAVPTRHIIDAPPKSQPQVPLSGAHCFAVDPQMVESATSGSRQHTQYPYVTGTSVFGVKYKDGVLIACDTLASYGSTKRYKSIQRIKQVNSKVVVAASGEISDFQYIGKLLDELTMGDYVAEDGIEMTPSEVYAYLCRVMYNRRNKFDPLWNSLVVGGVDGETHFLGTVGMIGTHYTDSHVTTGFANHLARPLFREKQSDDMTEEDAMAMIHEALKVCYYRDKQSMNKFQVAKVTEDGVNISEPFALQMKWDYQAFAQPTKWAVGAW